MSNYENLNDLEMSLTNHNIEFEQRLTEELLDSIQISNTTSTHNELIGLQGGGASIEPLNLIDPANGLRIPAPSASTWSVQFNGAGGVNGIIGAEGQAGNAGWAGTSGWAGYGWSTYVGDATSTGTACIRYEGNDASSSTVWAPFTTTYINPIERLPELMELILKCIEKGAPPRMLVDISEQIKKDVMGITSDVLDTIISQLKGYLKEKEEDVDSFVDDLVDDIEKTICGKKIIKGA